MTRRLELARLNAQKHTLDFAKTHHGTRDGVPPPHRDCDSLAAVLSPGRGWLKSALGKYLAKCKSIVEEVRRIVIMR